MHKLRRIIIVLLFFVCAGMLIYGFVIQDDDMRLSQKYIGLGVAGGFFVVMPMFIYHRWKNRNVKDYMLTKENILKMQDYRKDQQK